MGYYSASSVLFNGTYLGPGNFLAGASRARSARDASPLPPGRGGGGLDFLADITVPPEFNSTHIPPPWIILAFFFW